MKRCILLLISLLLAAGCMISCSKREETSSADSTAGSQSTAVSDAGEQTVISQIPILPETGEISRETLPVDTIPPISQPDYTVPVPPQPGGPEGADQ